TMTGGSGEITANAWQSHVPDNGSKTIASGDLVAFCLQMTARGGSDLVNTSTPFLGFAENRPGVTTFTSATYTGIATVPNCIITFSDGAIGFMQGCDVFSTANVRNFNSGS